MLAYVYGVVPLSLCRNGGCGLSEPRTRSDVLDEEELWAGGSGQFIVEDSERSHTISYTLSMVLGLIEHAYSAWCCGPFLSYN